MSIAPVTVKAEVVFAVLLTLRHRTVRLALGFGAAVVALAASGTVGAPGSHDATVLFVSGSVAVVAASRVLARGAALEAVRRTAQPWWFAPSCRLGGVMLVSLPLVLAAVIVLGADVADAARVAAVTIVYIAALAALTAALTPIMGASGAGAVGLLAAWLGAVPPSGIAAALARWPFLGAPVVSLWNTLPLEWRAERWARDGGVTDPAVLTLWVAAGILLAAWSAARAYRADVVPAREA